MLPARDGSKRSSLGLLEVPSEGLSLLPHRRPQLWNNDNFFTLSFLFFPPLTVFFQLYVVYRKYCMAKKYIPYIK
jgi:hypothetical protein